MIKTLFIMCIILISFRPLAANEELEQEVTLNRDNVLFKLKLLSQYELTIIDTLRVEFSITNSSRHPISVLDFDIPEKPYRGFIKIHHLKIELDMGGRFLTDKGMVRKFKIIKPGEQATLLVNIPVIRIIREFLEWQKREKIDNRYPYPYIKNVQVLAAIAFSESPEFTIGKFAELTKFNDYWGIPQNKEIYYEIDTFVEMFELCGVSVKIHLPESK
ncbi:MAG: hypothetical protein D6732_22005 [Methanobacteriota archaeon]|nr:MAG: hypothetical protein D6732_22005 [Euryarchaeota archaeon]